MTSLYPWPYILVVLMLHQVFSQSAISCLDAKTRCHRDVQCNMLLTIMRSRCGVNWDTGARQKLETCQPGQMDACKSIVRTLETKGFKDCECDSINDQKSREQCSKIWRQLKDKFCEDTNGVQRPGSKTDELETYVTQPKDKPKPTDPLNKVVNITGPISTATNENLRLILSDLGLHRDSSSSQVSCRERLEDCKKSRDCTSALDAFKQNCQFSTCEKNREACLSAYERVRMFNTFKCSCSREVQLNAKRECLQYQVDVIDNKCLALFNNRVLFDTGPKELVLKKTEENQKPKIVFESHMPVNCFNVYEECKLDQPCLRNYLELERVCKWDSTTNSCPNYSRCMMALRSMYQRSGDLVSKAALCGCPKEADLECQRHKQVFRPQCSFRNQTSINCLQLMSHCAKDMTCLDSYNIFTEYCTLQPRTTFCLPGFQSRCMDSYRTLWGGPLTLQCSCDPGETHLLTRHAPNRQRDPMKTCKQFQTLLVNPPCLRKPSEHTLPAVKLNYASEPCKIMHRHNLPLNVSIRVYPPDAPHSFCSRVCDCSPSAPASGNCKPLVCPPLATSSSPTSRRSSRDSCTIQSPLSATCRCLSNQKLVCDPFSPKLMQSNSGYLLNVEYNTTDQAMLDDLTNKPLDLVLMTSQLNKLIATSSESRMKCRLGLLSHSKGSIVYTLALIESLDSNVQSDNLGRIRQLKMECFNAAHLLVVMINQGYPKIRHNLILSVLYKASLDPANTPDTLSTWSLPPYLAPDPPMGRPSVPRTDKYNNRRDGTDDGSAASSRYTSSWLILTALLLLTISLPILSLPELTSPSAHLTPVLSNHSSETLCSSFDEEQSPPVTNLLCRPASKECHLESLVDQASCTKQSFSQTQSYSLKSEIITS